MGMRTTLIIILVLAICVMLPFLFWGDQIESLLVVDQEAGTLANQDQWAWAVGVGLLIADIVIPIPTTSIIAGLGIIYGPMLGAGVAILGSMLSAFIGYAIGRFLGRPIARRFAGSRLAEGDRLILKYGGWIVAASRWLPVLPEVISVVAGAHRMPVKLFGLSALCGVVPFSLAFATLGHVGADTPVLTLVIAAIAPLVLWLILQITGVTQRFHQSQDQ